jgi:hypothetical protein
LLERWTETMQNTVACPLPAQDERLLLWKSYLVVGSIMLADQARISGLPPAPAASTTVIQNRGTMGKRPADLPAAMPSCLTSVST